MTQKPTLLFAHATGLCAETWRALVNELAGKFPVHVFDFRGHGSRGSEPITAVGAQRHPSWEDFAASDVLREAEQISHAPARNPPVRSLPLPSSAVVGVGHSMGGAALVKAELKSPGTFAALVLFEPILLPRDVPFEDDATKNVQNPLARRAKGRRDRWVSRSEAREFIKQRSMFREWDILALEGYLEGGLVDLGDKDGEVRLACLPESEALCYQSVGKSVLHELENVRCPVTVIVGSDSYHLDGQTSPPELPSSALTTHPMSTCEYFRYMASLFPHSRFLTAPGGHFFPQESGALKQVAAAIEQAVAEIKDRPREGATRKEQRPRSSL